MEDNWCVCYKVWEMRNEILFNKEVREIKRRSRIDWSYGGILAVISTQNGFLFEFELKALFWLLRGAGGKENVGTGRFFIFPALGLVWLIVSLKIYNPYEGCVTSIIVYALCVFFSFFNATADGVLWSEFHATWIVGTVVTSVFEHLTAVILGKIKLALLIFEFHNLVKFFSHIITIIFE